MLPIHETRRLRLVLLIVRHGGLTANLNEKLGYARNDGRLNRIKNKNARAGRGEKLYKLGDPAARHIETALGLPMGWMDESLREKDVEELVAELERYPRVQAGFRMPDFGFDKIKAPVVEAFRKFADWPTSLRLERHSVSDNVPDGLDPWSTEAAKLISRLPDIEKKGALANLRAYVQQLGYTL